MTIHNLEGALEAQELGFKRVVLSRELSLDEIEYICSNTDIEIETFIHGALCISYSGQCLLSSMIGGRSGNRGKCAGPCRLPYELVVKQQDENTSVSCTCLSKGYILSTKDLCGLEFLPKLIDAGVMCFKIEGRMKTPEYVATVTRIYKKYIDLYLSGKPYVIDENDITDLMQVFNRGGFSSGHLDSLPNKDLVYPEKPNHMGIYIGNISNLNPNKGHIFVNLTNNVSLGDTVMFEKENTKYTISELMVKGKNITDARKKQLVEIGRMKGNLNIGDKIYKVNSKELTNSSILSYSQENKKIALKAEVTLKKDKPVILKVHTLNDINEIFNDISVSFSSDVYPVEAKSKPIDEERILAQLNKTTDTLFYFEDIKVDLDNNLFLPSIKVLNELRRNALEEILNEAKSKILRSSPEIDDLQIAESITNNIGNKEISVLLNILKNDLPYENLKNINNVYIPLKYFGNKNYENILNNICNNFNTYIYLPNIIKSNYKNLLNNVIENSVDKFNIKGFVISNLGNFKFISNIKQKYGNKFEYIGNYTLNIFNHQTETELKALGLAKLTVSPELDSIAMSSIIKNSPIKQELIVYGKTPLMTMNYCLLGKTNKCYPTCGTRCLEKDKEYYLKDRMGFYFRLIPDNIQTITTLYNSKTTSINGNDFDVSSYRVDIIDENIDEINNIVSSIISKKRLEGKNYTNGNLNREI